jgi:methionine-rich copper-binding protein CopC
VGNNVLVMQGNQWRRASRAVVALLWLGGLLTLAAAPAQAHASIRSITPADGARVTTPPKQVVIVFNETINPAFVQVALSSGGKAVATGEAVTVGPKVTLPITATLVPADYVVAFRVVSADGHPIAGTSTFTLVSPTATTSRPSSTTSGATAGTTSSAPSTSGAAETATTPGPTPTYKTPQRQPTTIGHPDHTPGLLVAGGLILAGIALAVAEHRQRSRRH